MTDTEIKRPAKIGKDWELTPVMIEDVPALICDDGRLPKGAFLEGYKIYHLRGWDMDPGIIASVEKKPVTVNWCGYLIVQEDHDLPEFKDYLSIKDTINYDAPFEEFGSKFALNDDEQSWRFLG